MRNRASWFDSHLLWEIHRIHLVCCYSQIYYQWQYLSHFEFLVQNLLCITDYTLLIRASCFFFSCLQ